MTAWKKVELISFKLGFIILYSPEEECILNVIDLLLDKSIVFSFPPYFPFNLNTQASVKYQNTIVEKSLDGDC